jgi:hypothetical protein
LRATPGSAAHERDEHREVLVAFVAETTNRRPILLGLAASAALKVLVVVGSRNLEHYDPALFGYTVASVGVELYQRREREAPQAVCPRCGTEFGRELRPRPSPSSTSSSGGNADYYGITYEKIERQNGVFWPAG